MGKKFKVDGMLQVGVITTFIDDGKNDLRDQAHEAIKARAGVDEVFGEIEIEHCSIDEVKQVGLDPG